MCLALAFSAGASAENSFRINKNTVLKVTDQTPCAGTGNGETTYVSNLPVIRLDGALLSTLESKPGKITVYDPQRGIMECDAAMKYRGTYSASFTLKRNYTLHLKTADGKQLKESLLGLRRDDDYALLGGYSDPSRLRITVGLDLFRAIGGNAPEAALCEVFFGEYYKGVYALVERPDRKSAGVPKDGALYRVLAQRVDGVDILSQSPQKAPAGEAWYNVGKVYPDGDEGWRAMEDFNAFLTSADDASFAREIENYLDLSAFADYYLFVNAIGASDNIEKNLFLAWDGEKFYPMPWDLDAAFGRLYNAEPSDPNAWYSSPMYERLLKTERFSALLKERYKVLRAAFLPENVTARFEKHADHLQANGAIEREGIRFLRYTDVTTQKTHALDVYGEIEYIGEFMEKRLELLDSTFLY